MKVLNPFWVYVFPTTVLAILVIVTLNFFRILPFGDAGTAVGIVITLLAFYLNLITDQIEKRKLVKKYQNTKKKIEKMCDEATSRTLSPILSNVFSTDLNDQKENEKKTKENLCDKYITDFDEQAIKKDITNFYTLEFLKKIKNEIKKERHKIDIENFIKYLIYKDFNYMDHAYNTYSNYQERLNVNNFFNALYIAYYQENIQNNFKELINKAKDIMRKKIRSENKILEDMPDSNKIKLESYIVNTLKKNLSFSTYIENIKNLPLLYQSFLIVLGEKINEQKQIIYEKLENEGGVTPISNTRFERIFFLQSKQNYQDIHKFLDNEVLKDIPRKHKFVILATRVFPTEVDYIQGGVVQEHFKSLQGSANKIRFNEKRLKNLLKISGKPILELIEGATIDFFMWRDDYLSKDERIKLVTKSEKIYEEIKSSIESGGMGVTELLKKSIENKKLAGILCKHCKLTEKRADHIVKSIKRNIESWKEIIKYQGG